MPILEIVFSRPLATPLATFHWACLEVLDAGARGPSATSSSSDSSSRYGLIAEQP